MRNGCQRLRTIFLEQPPCRQQYAIAQRSPHYYRRATAGRSFVYCFARAYERAAESFRSPRRHVGIGIQLWHDWPSSLPEIRGALDDAAHCAQFSFANILHASSGLQFCSLHRRSCVTSTLGSSRRRCAAQAPGTGSRPPARVTQHKVVQTL